MSDWKPVHVNVKVSIFVYLQCGGAASLHCGRLILLSAPATTNLPQPFDNAEITNVPDSLANHKLAIKAKWVTGPTLAYVF
jgi:hypothetical protein